MTKDQIHLRLEALLRDCLNSPNSVEATAQLGGALTGAMATLLWLCPPERRQQGLNAFVSDVNGKLKLAEEIKL